MTTIKQADKPKSLYIRSMPSDLSGRLKAYNRKQPRERQDDSVIRLLDEALKSNGF